jgi:preprotein translocase subunit YajC
MTGAVERCVGINVDAGHPLAKGSGRTHEQNRNYMMNTPLFEVLAQEVPKAPPAEPGGIVQLLIPVFAAIALYYFMILRPERRKQQNVQSRLEALKKNDRVVTIGGIYGVVVNVNRESDEVTLKIDEATNAKMRVTVGAVARILGEDSAEKANS